LHFAASTPNIAYGSDFYIPNFLLIDDLIVDPLVVDRGQILLPEEPGLGVRVDLEAVARFRTDR
jgi:L-alanine-DL-glutamate epimerase-like enolase superfamily enzyme